MDKERNMLDREELQRIQDDAFELGKCGPSSSPWRRACNQLSVAAGRVVVLLKQAENDE